MKDSRVLAEITEFRGENRYLSNFYPCLINFRKIAYPGAEHAFQAQKTLDQADRAIIAAQATPGDARHYGRSVELRPDWEQEKKTVMLLVVLAKFRQHGTLARQLIETGGRRLIEGNRWHDNFWGSCTCSRCGQGDLDNGLNYLGQILMAVRMVMCDDSRLEYLDDLREDDGE